MKAAEKTEQVVGVTADDTLFLALILFVLVLFFGIIGVRTYYKRGESLFRGAMTGTMAACVIFMLVFIITATIK